MDAFISLPKIEVSRYLPLVVGGGESGTGNGVVCTPGTTERSGCQCARRLLAAEEGVELELFFMAPAGLNLDIAGVLENVLACFRIVPGWFSSAISCRAFGRMCFRPESSLVSMSSSDG